MAACLAAGAAALLAGEVLAAPTQGRLAAWVVRDRITSPAAVEQVCREARRAGIDTLVVQVRGRGDAYYDTDLAPRAEALAAAPEGFDPLAEVLRQAEGLRVIAWLNVYYVWGGGHPPKDEDHVVRARAGWLLEDRDGRGVDSYSARERALGYIEGVYADPASLEYREHFAGIAAEVATRYRVDGIHLDFVRYPGPGYGKGPDLVQEFEARWGFDPRWIPRDLDAPDPRTLLAGTQPLSKRVLATAGLVHADLRASQVTELVRSVRTALREVRPELELSAAVFPNPGKAYVDQGQDWVTWAAEGLVDALFPMAYFGDAPYVGSQLRRASELLRLRAPGVRLWAGLGSYTKDPAQVGEEALRAWEAGCHGVCLFDLGTLLNRGGLDAHVEAVAETEGPVPDGALSGPSPAPYAGEAELLARAIDRASAGGVLWGEAERRAVEARWGEYQGACRGPLLRALGRLSQGRVRPPEWVELRGIFRHVGPDSGEEKRQLQRARAEEALARLRRGEDPSAVAKELSQWSNREWGGVLRRRYLSHDDPTDRVLSALSAGQASPVVEVHNGYWVYRVDAKGGDVPAPLSDLPWPARRVLLKAELAKELDPAAQAHAGEGGSSAAPQRRLD